MPRSPRPGSFDAEVACRTSLSRVSATLFQDTLATRPIVGRTAGAYTPRRWRSTGSQKIEPGRFFRLPGSARRDRGPSQSLAKAGRRKAARSLRLLESSQGRGRATGAVEGPVGLVERIGAGRRAVVLVGQCGLVRDGGPSGEESR